MRLPTNVRGTRKAGSTGAALAGLTLLGGVLWTALSLASDGAAPDAWWVPDSHRTLDAKVAYANPSGALSILNEAGAVSSESHAFFTSIGSNGRACVTCHQPANGMSVSADALQARWAATAGADPVFAAIDGSNCPSLPQQDPASHSLLLNKGLVRIFRAWPPRTAEGAVIKPEFSVEVVSDPAGCNLDPKYGLKSAKPQISVYRRPRPVANLKYALSYGFVFEPKNGLPLPLDAKTGLRYSGNLMADQRDRTLEEQMLDAMASHLERREPPSALQVEQIKSFESQVYAAQSVDRNGGLLSEGGASGGPAALSTAKAGELKSSQHLQWSEFLAWQNAAQDGATSEAQKAFRLSVARGAATFRDRTFLISDSAGLNSMNFGNPTRDSCNFCHNMTRTGMDVAPGQVDLGTTNLPFADPAPELPLFKLTCDAKYPAHPFLGRVIYTHDPGFALTTGKCIDIGKITIQSMRGLAARAPYFSNGSARTLRDVIDFYDRRYNIGYTEQEKQDLTNLMNVL
jgi:hypothetical protein